MPAIPDKSDLARLSTFQRDRIRLTQEPAEWMLCGFLLDGPSLVRGRKRLFFAFDRELPIVKVNDVVWQFPLQANL